MKKKTSLIVILGSTIFATIIAITNSAAWFTHTAFVGKSQNPFGGTVEDAYYAYGDGTADNPFGISRPRHLYNLAWLQFLGFYNHTNDHQYYFELAADIDMSDYSALPPIGTELNPFVGNFNGQGYTISNLTVSNSFDDYTLHPAAISAFDNSTKKQPHILGLFGVVGTYTGANIQESYSSSANTIVNTGIVGINVKSTVVDSLMGLAAGYVSATISGVAVDSGTLDVPDVANTTSYPIVDSHGKYTDNISDYGLVGYTVNKTSIKKVTNTLYDLQVQTGQEYVSNWQGSNAGWGGSIDMNSIFDRLNAYTSNADMTATTYERKDEDFDITYKHLNGDDDPNYPNYPKPTVNDSQYVDRFVGYGLTDDDPETTNVNEATYDYRGSIVFSHKEYAYVAGNNKIKGEGKFYLVGGHYQTDEYYQAYDRLTGYRITDGDGNYLVFNGSGIENSTDTNCIAWEFETTANNTSGYIRTYYNGTYYYLMNNAGVLGVQNVAENAATDWTISITGNNLNISSTYNTTTYSVLFDNGWGLFDKSISVHRDAYSSVYYSSGNTRYYVPATIINATGAVARTNEEQLEFNLVDSTRVTFKYGGNTYYLYAYALNGSYYITANTNATPGTNLNTLYFYSGTGTTGYIRTSTTISYNRQNYYVFFRYSNSNWTYGTRRSNQTNPTTYYSISYVSNPAVDERPYEDLNLSNALNASVTSHRERLLDDQTTEGMRFNYEDTTYFPINVYEEDTKDEEGKIIGYKNEATINNTGYFVAGTTDTTWSGDGSSSPRSIIISSYPKTGDNAKLATSSYEDNVFKDAGIYTIDGSGAHAIDTTDTEKYSKYESSKSGLAGVLHNDNNPNKTVGGFHFYAKDPDQATPSMNSIVEARDVRMRGAEKRSYQLPVYSLDFYLKEQGRINFLAGMYNGGNGTGTTNPSTGTSGHKMNGFFSLYKIDRNGDAISNIRKIKAIYQQEGSNSYVYTYVDGKCTVALDGTTTCSIVDEDGNPITNLSTFISNNNLTLLFDAQWIWYRPLHTDPGRVYYFEIPVNEGEYCLGGYETPTNVEMDGAYLMYLDIGASAAQMQRTMVAEHFLEDVCTYSYPNGVALIPVNTIGTVNFNASNSLCFVVLPNYRGAVTVDRDDANHVALTRAANYRDTSKPNYVSDVIVSVVDPGITSGSNDISSITLYDSKITTETFRVEYYDYNVKQEKLTKTVIEDTRTQTNGGAWSALSRKITQQVDNGAVLQLTSQTQINSGLIAIFKYLGPTHGDTGKVWTYAEISSTTSTVFYDSSAKTTTTACSALTTRILELYHLLDGNVTANTQFKVELVVDGTYDPKIFYKFNDFVIVPTVTNGSVVYKVTYINTNKTIYFIDNGTQFIAVGDTGTANPPANP